MNNLLCNFDSILCSFSFVCHQPLKLAVCIIYRGIEFNNKREIIDLEDRIVGLVAAQVEQLSLGSLLLSSLCTQVAFIYFPSFDLEGVINGGDRRPYKMRRLRVGRQGASERVVRDELVAGMWSRGGKCGKSAVVVKSGQALEQASQPRLLLAVF